jgi:hypothetical protein
MTALTCWCARKRNDVLLQLLPAEVLFKVFDWICKPPFVWMKRCFECGVVKSDMQRCSSCKVVHFCDVACLRAAWPSHKEACLRKKNHAKGRRIDLLRNGDIIPNFTDDQYEEHVKLVQKNSYLTEMEKEDDTGSK